MFFFKPKECSHPRVTPDMVAGYCPDCGKYVKNRWFLTRCACCNVKRKSTVNYEDVLPETRYCPNCGCEEFYIEEIKKINFIDINYAVLVKYSNGDNVSHRSQSWLERENFEPIKLLGMNLVKNLCKEM